ncbi:uncharacterized protein BDR25DRAFT_394765 [Lindgomyces ingoldianus]|uniref:Uncharacterized protein n=1 Tax=Lindgomyces ingoldianus TaxID=673940 RepID=A0ACB6QNB0_9PLEO|nr:uncharacterized protein BDR25DRAFT_394765 [Lindgomyces ingoldianus]KAF2468499.1 hypothetical protein BDR25DRAFT_394765 [Lindgomyces ingoldianus]
MEARLGLSVACCVPLPRNFELSAQDEGLHYGYATGRILYGSQLDFLAGVTISLLDPQVAESDFSNHRSIIGKPQPKVQPVLQSHSPTTQHQPHRTRKMLTPQKPDRMRRKNLTLLPLASYLQPTVVPPTFFVEIDENCLFLPERAVNAESNFGRTLPNMQDSLQSMLCAHCFTWMLIVHAAVRRLGETLLVIVGCSFREIREIYLLFFFPNIFCIDTRGQLCMHDRISVKRHSVLKTRCLTRHGEVEVHSFPKASPPAIYSFITAVVFPPPPKFRDISAIPWRCMTASFPYSINPPAYFLCFLSLGALRHLCSAANQAYLFIGILMGRHINAIESQWTKSETIKPTELQLIMHTFASFANPDSQKYR